MEVVRFGGLSDWDLVEVSATFSVGVDGTRSVECDLVTFPGDHVLVFEGGVLALEYVPQAVTHTLRFVAADLAEVEVHRAGNQVPFRARFKDRVLLLPESSEASFTTYEPQVRLTPAEQMLRLAQANARRREAAMSAALSELREQLDKLSSAPTHQVDGSPGPVLADESLSPGAADA